MGIDGALVRTSDGAWNWINVDHYTLREPNQLLVTRELLTGEAPYTLAIGLLALVILFDGFSEFGMESVIGIVLILIIMGRQTTSINSGWYTWEGFNDDVFSLCMFASFVYLPLVLFIQILVFFRRKIHRPRAPILAILLLDAFGIVCLYNFPYLLWTLGLIPRRSSAVPPAVVLVAFGMLAGFVHLRRLRVPSARKPRARRKPKGGAGESVPPT